MHFSYVKWKILLRWLNILCNYVHSRTFFTLKIHPAPTTSVTPSNILCTPSNILCTPSNIIHKSYLWCSGHPICMALAAGVVNCGVEPPFLVKTQRGT